MAPRPSTSNAKAIGMDRIAAARPRSAAIRIGRRPITGESGWGSAALDTTNNLYLKSLTAKEKAMIAGYQLWLAVAWKLGPLLPGLANRMTRWMARRIGCRNGERPGASERRARETGGGGDRGAIVEARLMIADVPFARRDDGAIAELARFCVIAPIVGDDRDALFLELEADRLTNASGSTGNDCDS